jgi:hypothetical protein
MVGQASSLSIKNDGQDARHHQIFFLFTITFENPYKILFSALSAVRSLIYSKR